tara:strand:- start:176 stop:928 length:753 start_codon:yes stop_codon:yes gene_type:complete
MANIKKISKVTAGGKVTFTDGATTSNGSKADCDYYGGTIRNSKCFLPTRKKIGLLKQAESNKRIGDITTNSINSHNTNVQGKGHRLNQVIDSTIIGNKADTNLSNAFVIGGGKTLGRNQVTTLFYEGKTVTTTDDTELFLGGESSRRFEVDESYNRIVYGLDIHTTFKSTGDTASGYIHSKACFQSTSGTLAINGSHTSLFATSGLSASNIVLTATAGSPDYIKVHVVGDRTLTQEWAVIINVFELRTDV